MFDPVGTFKKAFIPTEHGYIYYSSAKSGGKFISADEYEILVSNWHRVAGRGGLWKNVGFVVILIIVWSVLQVMVPLPDWADDVFFPLVVIGISARLLWASLAPWRLVRGRPDISPSRPMAQVRRQARAALSWPFILFCLLFSGMAFAGHLFSKDRSFGSWAWMFGGGAMFVLYLWAGFRKFRDRMD